MGKTPPQDYERGVIEDFATDGAPDILIVVDKLLTGFDEPRNAVLYIDKPLEGHSIIQAIARVNRLHPAKEYGLLIDYRGILAKLDTAVAGYQLLEERTLEGYEVKDIEGLYHQVNTEYKRLPALHDALWAIFNDVGNKKDIQQFRQVLTPHYATDPGEDGDLYDTRQKVREDFYQALTVFGLCLKVALASRSFYEDGAFDEKTVAMYKKDLAFFIELRKIARRDAQETVDYSIYEEQIRKLVDKHVMGEGITVAEDHYLVDELGQVQDPSTWSTEKLRNETDIIKSRVRKSIDQELTFDPYAQKYFSQLLKEAIAKAEEMFNHPYKQFALFQEFEERVRQRRMADIPEALREKERARAFSVFFAWLKARKPRSCRTNLWKSPWPQSVSFHWLSQKIRLTLKTLKRRLPRDFYRACIPGSALSRPKKSLTASSNPPAMGAGYSRMVVKKRERSHANCPLWCGQYSLCHPASSGQACPCAHSCAS